MGEDISFFQAAPSHPLKRKRSMRRGRHRVGRKYPQLTRRPNNNQPRRDFLRRRIRIRLSPKRRRSRGFCSRRNLLFCCCFLQWHILQRRWGHLFSMNICPFISVCFFLEMLPIPVIYAIDLLLLLFCFAKNPF